jgi:hypothetical protein
MKLIITIDTEEDNWGGYNDPNVNTSNIKHINRLQTVFDTYHIRPTYLVTWPVVNNDFSVDVLGDILNQGKCEIGAHCHPWNTPPLNEERNDYNSMLCNLTPALQHDKLQVLTDFIECRFGTRPVSFRSGRWGFNASVAQQLVKLGYCVDSSITPYIDWSSYYGPDYSHIELQPYWKDINQIYNELSPEGLIEIPSTVGYLQDNYKLASRIHRLLTQQHIKRLRIYGILYNLGLLNRIWLCPEMQTLKEMIGLTRALQKKNFSLINLMFHSSTLKAGLTPFVRSASDEITFIEKIRAYLDFVEKQSIVSVTLSEAACIAAQNTALCN